MKRLFLAAGLLAGFLLFLGTLGFLWSKSWEPEKVYDVLRPASRDIVVKTVATGAIVPRVEVELKSRVSGVVAELLVQPGDTVARGDRIAVIQVIPDASALSTAQARVQRARIERDDARTRRGQAESLFASGALSAAERDRARLDGDLADADLASAAQALAVVRDGAVRGAGDVATDVRSTVAGMVLDVPIEAGSSVIESNTFNDGTTIAVVANMADMVFEGTVDESEVGRIRDGMPLVLTIGAMRQQRFDGTLEYISPKGTNVDGSVQFDVRAALVPVEGTFIRAGSSANADIVLDRATEVLAIEERAVVYEKDGSTFVEVQTSEQRFERRPVKLGLSDGLYVQVLDGLEAGESVKKRE